MSSAKKHFDELLKQGNPVGEVIGVNRFIVRVKGLQPISIHALVLFEDGSKGIVYDIREQEVVVLHLGNGRLSVGMVVVMQHPDLVCKVGKDFIGRVVSTTGEPLDGKGPIAADATWPVFNNAPKLFERETLRDQLETGVMIVDSLFPLAKGQRITAIGDSKSGKSTLATQIAINQKSTDAIVVYVLIAKKRSDINALLSKLQANDALSHTIVVVSTMFDSLVLSYLAPYIGCSIAEYVWQSMGRDAVIIYDDLTAHAFAYREIALLAGTNPGRDAYPGDMFYAHASLLERAGKLKKNKKTLTSIPITLASSGDITAFLPTNIISITDGQWVMDLNVFHDGLRPAINVGLSVSRVGGRGHNRRQKQLALSTNQAFAAFREAKELSHFGSELALAARKNLDLGKRLRELFTQAPGEHYTVMAQQMMLDIVLHATEGQVVDLEAMKSTVSKYVAMCKSDEDFNKMRDELKQSVLLELKR